MLHTPQTICRYVNSSRGCKFGTNCKFAHVSNLPTFYSRSHENDKPVNPGASPATFSSQPYHDFNQKSKNEAVNNFQKGRFEEEDIPKDSLNNNQNDNEKKPAVNQNFDKKSFQDHKQDHGDDKAVDPTRGKVCFSYSRHGKCRYGTKCIFRHEIKEKSSSSLKSENVAEKHSVNTESTREESSTQNVVESKNSDSVGRKAICKFFKIGRCQFGGNCKFYHGNDETKKDKGKTPAKSDGPQRGSEGHKQAPRNVRTTVPRRQPYRPEPAKVIKRSEAKEEDIKKLRSTEIQQLKRRFPRDKLKTLNEEDNQSIFLLYFTSSDPDWPYDMKVFELEITFLSDYPLQCFRVVLPEDQDIPDTVREHVESSILDWLSKKQDELEKSDRLELVFRPFIRWLDKSLEEIVTEALKQLKRELFMKAAGIEFIPASKLKAKLSAGKDDSSSDDEPSEEQSQPEASLLYRKSQDEEQVYTGPERRHSDPGEFDSNQENLCPMPVANLNMERKGTEIKLQNLQLKENISTITFTHCKIVIQCVRCKATSDVHTPAGRVNMVDCFKCHNMQYLTFRPSILHPMSSVLGYLDLEECIPVDMVLLDSACKIGCFSCGKETKIDNLSPGRMLNTWCRFCNAKMIVVTDEAKFTLLLKGGVEKDKSEIFDATEKKTKKIMKDPLIKIGTPLPENGTCKHYKKSYRWFRFPCCGKTYPCDVCHDEREFDHDMVFANRMICGFCCKEQPYSAEKPCIACNHSMTRASTDHWEGGKGCRDKIRMSRDDVKKYSNLNKTISRKAAAEKPGNKKKNIKLRHSSN